MGSFYLRTDTQGSKSEGGRGFRPGKGCVAKYRGWFALQNRYQFN